MIGIACLVVFCLVMVKVVLALFDKLMKRSKSSVLLCKILRTIVKAFLLFIVIIVVLGSMGVSVSSLIAMLSVVGVAFSLAIQGFLGNVFGGIQIISNHPFEVGDYVEAGGVAGSVREVGLFYTKLDTPDKKLIQVPNSIIANESIVNYSNATHRRLEFVVSASYNNDVEQVRGVLLGLLTAHAMIIHDDPDKTPMAHVKEYRDNDICYVARAWCENKNYWTVYFEIMDAIKPAFDKEGIIFSYPNVNVYMQGK